MKDFLEWILRIACFLCFFQVFLQVIPRNSYRKYLRFFGSVMLLLMAVRPLLTLFGQDGEWDRMLLKEISKGEYGELSLNVEGLEELNAKVVTEAFQQEVTRQIRRIPEAYGFGVSHLLVDFDEGGMTPEKVEMEIEIGEEGLLEVEDMEWELSQVLGIDRERLSIQVSE